MFITELTCFVLGFAACLAILATGYARGFFKKYLISLHRRRALNYDKLLVKLGLDRGEFVTVPYRLESCLAALEHHNAICRVNIAFSHWATMDRVSTASYNAMTKAKERNLYLIVRTHMRLHSPSVVKGEVPVMSIWYDDDCLDIVTDLLNELSEHRRGESNGDAHH